MTETRIRWEDETPGNGDVYNVASIGYIGTRPGAAFRIYAPDHRNCRWLLSVRLTEGGKFIYGDNPEALKAEAERWLEEFTASLGAVFPGGHPDGNAIEAYCATEAGDGDGRHLLQYAVRLPDGTTTAYGDQSWVKAGLGARDHAGASTVVRDIWVSYGPWRTHETSAPVAADSKEHR